MELNPPASSPTVTRPIELPSESVLTSAILFCWHCAASSPSRHPDGWVILNEDKKSGTLSFGVCPDCLAREYHLPPVGN